MKNKFTIHVNEYGVRKLKLSQDEVNVVLKECEDLNKRGSVVSDLPKQLILIKGQGGRKGYIKNESGQESIVYEVPLSVNARDERSWLKCVRTYFKTILHRFESKSVDENFKKIKEKPYREGTGKEFNPDNPRKFFAYKWRTQSFVKRADYGTKSGMMGDRAERNAWIRKRYAELKRDKTLSGQDLRYERVREELEPKQFGRAEKDLSVERIKAIVYSKGSLSGREHVHA